MVIRGEHLVFLPLILYSHPGPQLGRCDHFFLSRWIMPMCAVSTGHPWVAGAGGSDCSPALEQILPIWVSASPAGVMGSESWCVRRSRYGPRSDDAAYPWLLLRPILYGRSRRAAWR